MTMLPARKERLTGEEWIKRRHNSLSPPPQSAGLDSPEEIKPVCNLVLLLHVCVFTTWPHCCCTLSLSQLCLWSTSFSIKSEKEVGTKFGCIHCPWLTASERGRFTVPVFLHSTDKWWAINLQPPLPPSSHGHAGHFRCMSGVVCCNHTVCSRSGSLLEGMQANSWELQFWGEVAWTPCFFLLGFFFSIAVICRRGPEPQITGSGTMGLSGRGNGLWGATVELVQWKPHGF